MTDEDRHDGEISLYALAATLIRNRWRIVRWMLIGAVFAYLSVISKPVLFRATASFVPQSSDAGTSSLAALAGQFGVAIPSASQSLSPFFYSKLLQSTSVLRPIVRDSFVVPGAARHLSFAETFKIGGTSAARREELALDQLRKMVTVTIDKSTGVLEFSVATKWPSVSLAIVTDLLNGVNDYNTRIHKGQATAERQFVEGRLALASADLRAAEDRMTDFLRANRDLGGSPALMLERERMQRTIGLRQQVFTTLSQSYEDARIREVRDIPVISVFEPPSVPTTPEPRGRAKRILLGLLIGGFFGTVLAFLSALGARSLPVSDPDAQEFSRAVSEMRARAFGGFGSLWARRSR